jgi:hypothetical protein
VIFSEAAQCCVVSATDQQPLKTSVILEQATKEERDHRRKMPAVKPEPISFNIRNTAIQAIAGLDSAEKSFVLYMINSVVLRFKEQTRQEYCITLVFEVFTLVFPKLQHIKPDS